MYITTVITSNGKPKVFFNTFGSDNTENLSIHYFLDFVFVGVCSIFKKFQNFEKSTLEY